MKSKPEIFNEQALIVSPEKGHELIQAGLARLNADRNEGVIRFVTGVMEQLRELQFNRLQLDKHIEFQQDRLKAIDEGKFNVNTIGQISFDETRLNA